MAGRDLGELVGAHRSVTDGPHQMRRSGSAHTTGPDDIAIANPTQPPVANTVLSGQFVKGGVKRKD